MPLRCLPPIRLFATHVALPWVTAGVAFAVLVAGAAPDAARPLADRVTITRDTRGVPHITGETMDAAAFGFGYAMAEDHAAEIGRKYITARGDSARHFGSEFAARDLAMRTMRNREGAREALRGVDRAFRAWLTAFAAGINHYVATHRDEVPSWMPTVEPGDPLALGRMGTITGALTPPAALLRKYPAAGTSPSPPVSPGSHYDNAISDLARGAARSTDALDEARSASSGSDPADEDAGSNAFALGGAHTTVGVPLLLGNPHLRWSERYWEAHVQVPDRIDFYGSTLVGIPVLRAGFNADVAYVQTNNAPDDEDIYALAVDPVRTDVYTFAGKTHRIERRPVSVDVRQADGSMTLVTRMAAFTHLGPVVHETPGRIFAVRALGLDWWRHYEGFFQLWRVRSRAEFERVLDRQVLSTSNFTYADTRGDILYRWNARLPKRADIVADYSLDVDWSDPRRLWRGIHAARDLPRLFNPSGGYIQNANNAPWWTSLRDRLDPTRYPSYVERGALGLRPQAILGALEMRARWSPDDVIAAKYDTRVVLADRVLPDLLAAAARVDAPSVELRDAVTALAAWDRRVDAESRGAVLFERFWEAYRERREVLFAEDWTPERPIDTPRGLADPRAAIALLETAARDVRTRHGDLGVAWGAVHRFRFGALDLPADGAPGTPFGLYRVVGFDQLPDGTRIAGHRGMVPGDTHSPMAGTGDAWVLLVQLSRPVRAWSIVAYGQSSDLASPHSTDQIRDFAGHRLRPVWFSAAEVAANAERSYRPGSRGAASTAR